MRRTKKEIDKIFVAGHMPSIRKKEKEYQGTSRTFKDTPLRCQEYNNFLDYLRKDGIITSNQARSYTIPAYLIK
jgi:hypothetical protein